MDDKQYAILTEKLDVIAKLLTASITQGKSLTEKAVMISSIGLQTKDLVLLLGKDSDLISQTLYQAKESKGRKSGRKR